MSKLISKALQWHCQFFALVSYLQSPLLLFVRLYWGWQLAQSGWGKLHHLSNVREYFATLGLPMPAQMAVAYLRPSFSAAFSYRSGPGFPDYRPGSHREPDDGLRYRRPRGAALFLFRSGQIRCRRPLRVSDGCVDCPDFWRGQNLCRHGDQILAWFHAGEASEFSASLIDLSLRHHGLHGY